MRRVHLLRVVGEPSDFAALIAAGRVVGQRLGWLELSGVEPPARLASAAATGVMRAVASGDRFVVSVKRLQGDAVLDDLLREHFRGCSAVLVAGELDLPRLAPNGDGWCVTGTKGSIQHFDTSALLEMLRRANPFKN